MCRKSPSVLTYVLGILLSVVVSAGCEEEKPVLTGSGGDAPSGVGVDSGAFDFDVSGGDGGTSGDVGDADVDTGPVADAGCTRSKRGIEQCDGRDNDCNGVVDDGCDEDGDGYCAEGASLTDTATCEPEDCDDSNAAINPGAAPACDGLDNNCDGEVDNLVAQPGRRATVSLTGAASTSSDGPSPVLAAFAGDGFCVAALDDRGDRLEFAMLGADGGSSTHSASVDRTLTVDLLDLAWDGTDCVALFREGPLNLQIRRWRPGSSSSTSLEVTQFLSGDDDWENVRNAALWFGEVARCDEGRCTTEPRWVVVYLSNESSLSADVVYKTVPQGFGAREVLAPARVVNSSATVNADVDVAGTGARGDGFMVVDNASRGATTVHEVVEEQATLRSDLTINNVDVDRPAMMEINGELVLQRRRALSSTRFETVLAGVSTSGYRPEGVARSGAQQRYVGREFASPIDATRHLYLDGYADQIFRADVTGTGDRFFEFTALEHPNFGRSTELLAPGRAGGYLWVASLISESPYEVAADAFGCY